MTDAVFIVRERGDRMIRKKRAGRFFEKAARRRPKNSNLKSEYSKTETKTKKIGSNQ
jgi:hypothetical protein